MNRQDNELFEDSVIEALIRGMPSRNATSLNVAKRVLIYYKPIIEKQGFRDGVQSVIDYLKKEVATTEERSAGEPKLKAHFNAMEKGVLGTVISALEEWQTKEEECKGEKRETSRP